MSGKREMAALEAQAADFSRGSVAGNIMNLAVPMMLAQLVNVLYNVVDRMYIGRIPGEGKLALTGLGLTFPIISIVTAFSNLFGQGGAPLFSIQRGKGNQEEAGHLMGNSFALLVISGLTLTVIGLLVKTPMLYLFGASDATYPYADAYLTVYLCGSIFVMIGLGMNGFINAQGFGKTGMMTVLVGAVINILLDPLFIFVFNMGVRGAALATVISQAVSALWVLRFLTGKKAGIRLELKKMRLKWRRALDITVMGTSGFMMSITNSLVQIFCNSTLQNYGGDAYVGVMTVLQSVRDVLMMPVNGLTNAAQPVMGFNYGARKYQRVCRGIRFTSIVCVLYTVAAWAVIWLFPEALIRIFNDDAELISLGVPSMHIYFFGFFMMSLQFAGQSVFVGLGKPKQAVCFSILRKVVIVVPLTVLLPAVGGLGTTGVFLAEPISNFIGGLACYLTMLFMVYWPMRKKPDEKTENPVDKNRESLV